MKQEDHINPDGSIVTISRCRETHIGKNVTLPEGIRITTFSHLGNNVVIENETKIGQGVKIGNNSHIGMYTKIDAFTSIGDNTSIAFSSIGQLSSIGNNVKVSSAYMGRSIVIGDGCNINDVKGHMGSVYLPSDIHIGKNVIVTRSRLPMFYESWLMPMSESSQGHIAMGTKGQNIKVLTIKQWEGFNFSGYDKEQTILYKWFIRAVKELQRVYPLPMVNN